MNLVKQLAQRRFKPLDIALAILFAGWVPSVLITFVSYSILTRTLESKIIVDRSTLVQTLAHLIGYDLVRTGEIMEYYQTLPLTQEMLERPYGDLSAQEWLAGIYYSQPRIDGMFLADSEGRLIALLPMSEELIGERYRDDKWLPGAGQSRGSYVSAVHARLPDERLATAIVVPVRSAEQDIIGYLGSTVLVERLGRRLSTFNFGERSVAQVIDQNGFPLFERDFSANKSDAFPASTELLRIFGDKDPGYSMLRDNFYTYSEIEPTEWTAVLEQPVAVAYAPVRELLTRTLFLAGWLVVGTGIAAWLVSRLYANQLRADERIARETLFNEKILANMPTGIALIHPTTGRLLQANESFLKAVRQFTPIPENAAATDLTFADIDLGLGDMLSKVCATGVPFQSHEQRVVSLSGEPHFLTTNLLRLQDVRNRTLGVLCLLEDNTADVSLRKELIDANTAKDQFLALLSHELRNPLSPVITMVEELESVADPSEEVQTALDIIRRNVELEARLIDDLLDITRIAHKKLQLSRETVDAHQAIRRALEICGDDIRAKNLQITLDLAAEQHHAYADPARLQQVFWNLIKNAVKFTPAGAITITTCNEDANLLVDVTDTGIGIEPERIEKVFKAFEQGESSITRQFGGLGLGLAISDAMVRAHGGKLTAESAGTGKGATFTIELATVPPPATSPAPAEAPTVELAENGHLRILIVDDHEDTCLGMKMLLERRGYQVTVAHSLQQALAASNEKDFDLLISDLGLPDGTGFELMEKLRSRNGIKGIALSGFGMEEDIKRSHEAGFIEHMIKPINVERLDAILRQLAASE